MNFNDSLYVSVAGYSCTHPNRAAALNHFFCVNGNGYDWIDGQLVDTCESDPTHTPSQQIALIFDHRRERHEAQKKEEERLKAERLEPSLDAKIEALIDEAVRKIKEEREADPEAFEKKKRESETAFQKSHREWEESKKWDYCVPDNINERLQDTSDFNRWYPMCQYSAMVDFPDDIQPDWLDALIETAQLVIERPNFSTYPAYMKASATANVICAAKNKEIAEAAILRAVGLKEARQ